MKRREPPKAPIHRAHPKLKHDPQVKKWTQRLLADASARPDDLDEEQLEFVYQEVMRERGEEFSDIAFFDAMDETRPKLAAPDWTDNAEDLGQIFSQPELRDFWLDWEGEQKPKGSEIDFAPAKLVMTTMAMSGTTPHLEKMLDLLGRDPQTRAVFDALEGRTLELKPYSTTDRHFTRIAKSCVIKAQETNIACVKALRTLYPSHGYGDRLLIDSPDVAAWVRQHGTNNDEQEAFIRRRTPEAGFRRYEHTANGKRNIKKGEKIVAGSRKLPKEWRGYYFTVIVDQASGLPLVWMLHDANRDEAPAIVPLLSRLYRLWPDCPAKLIAGDSAWDEGPWCRLCEADYGIAPIFRLHKSEPDKAWIMLEDGDSRDNSVMAITREGQLVCAAHKKPLDYDSFDAPSRGSLYPGKTNEESLFRLRGKCTHSKPGAPPCGRIGLRAKINWFRLTRYPHHPHGDPRRYAFRQAMLIRLNGAESLFNRLKAGKLLGAKGADRTRFIDINVVEALLSLACLSFTALALACEREHLGVAPQHVSVAGPVVTPVTQLPPPVAPVPTPTPAPVVAPAATASSAVLAAAPTPIVLAAADTGLDEDIVFAPPVRIAADW
jgi:hypothetical protein